MEFHFPEVPQVFWAFVNFLILFAALYKILYKPVLTTMSAREKEIAENIARAEAANREAAELSRRLNEQLAKANAEAQEIVANARKAAEADREALLAAAREEADRMREKAKADIARERDSALAAIREQVADLTILAASKLVRKSLDSAEHRRLVAEVVGEMGGPGMGGH